MSPALSLAQSAHDDESSLVSTAQRIRELEGMLLVARREAEDSADRVLRLTAGLEQALAMAQTLQSRGGVDVPSVAVTLVVGAISAVLGTALEET